MRILNLIAVGALVVATSCQEKEAAAPELAIQETTKKSIKVDAASEKIQVLNLGTFHMGFTTDANSTKFDEHNKENQKKVHKIAEKIAHFDPTVILVEAVPQYNQQLQASYDQYLKNPDMHFENPTEVELLAYEVGRLSGTKHIYGIDHKMNYNYRIGQDIENTVDSTWYNRFYANPIKFFQEVNLKQEELSLAENLKLHNHDRYLDFLIAANADMLTHAGTENNFEGADEAAKFYQRNLRMYSNLNRVDLHKDDRVLILLGAAHTAFFRDFMSRSPKYNMVDTFEYLQ
jgi:hypothetical protein